jgi:thiamine-phosphate pyrophosphorylase
MVAIAKMAIAGGVGMVQMREKNKSSPELLKEGKELRAICKKAGVRFIVNDDPYLAKKIDADGVHLGQEDIELCSVNRARSILGADKLIGLSTHSCEEFEKAVREDIDYAAFGPIFKTKTKDYHIGTGDVKTVLGIGNKPVFFIGGIDLSNVGELLKMGAKNIAMIRAIAEAPDVEAAARSFKKEMTRW